MGGKRFVAAIGVLVGAGLLTGCCLFSGDPTVTLMGPTTATVGQPVTFMAQATGGGGQYTYVWMGAMGQGQMATATFTSPGQQIVMVTVTDNCGKSASAQWPITVTGDSQGGNLTGTWQGEIVEFTGRVFELRLSLVHAGQTLQGTAYHAGRASTGSGTFIGTQIMFQFPFWFNTAVNAVLTGTVMGNEMSGTWRIGTTIQHTWRLTKI
ncbi:MAG: PKD domain-containing protein [Candidatus Bipolaricaulota bacterium]